METVIYSASPIEAFLGIIITIGFFFVIGGGGFLLAIFRRKSKRKRTSETVERVALGYTSVILLLAGALMTFVSINTFFTGDNTVVVIVDNKRIVESNCDTSTNSRTCTSYVVETHTEQKYYDFSIPENVWEEMQVNSCYQVTYYPPQSLLGEYLQKEDTSSSSYESASTITSIETANCP